MRGAGKKLARAVSAVLRTASICVPLSTGLPTIGIAQSTAAATLTADIAAQPLALALKALAEQTGLQLVYVSDVVRDKRSTPVPAGSKVGRALTGLLRGTGLRFEYLTSNSVRILAPEVSPIRPVSTVTEGPFEEVIVTANRRDESLQKVPLTIEVLTGAELSSRNATTFEDFLESLPAVTAHGVGPAQNNIYVRGLATGEYPNQAAGTNGVFPNVAIYLDEQSAQLPGRNLDIYVVDLARIEVLEGPQGTLFGAGAQAGVLRYITNQPKLDLLEGSVTASTGMTSHGAPNSAFDAVINLPLITDRLALRGVIYNERRGGYIDNTPATFARSTSDLSIGYANYPGGCGAPGAARCQVPPGSVVINNAAELGSNINPVTYEGLRVEALLQLPGDWSVLLAQSYQNLEADGVFAEEAVNSLGVAQRSLTAQLFNPSYDKDRFENTALTVTGRAGPLKLLYAGSYLVRNVEQVQDYTNYARTGQYADYYQCVNPGVGDATAHCFTPSETWHDRVRNTHLSQELRLTTPDDWRIRGIGGLFYEDYKIFDQGDWYYLTALPYFAPIGPPTGYYSDSGNFVHFPVTSNNPNLRPAGDAFFNDTLRGYTQKAAFASIDAGLIPQILSASVGTRYSYTRDAEVGSQGGAFGCRLYDNPAPPPAASCVDHGFFQNLNALGLVRRYAGFRSRANLSWRPHEALLFYYTWSQGFRAGGFNRQLYAPPLSPLSTGQLSYQAQANLNGGWNPPQAYSPDTLVNNEIGWKTRWLDQRLEWNGALYQEDWAHAQLGSQDDQSSGNAVVNGGNYRVRGLETSVKSRLAGGFSVELSAAWNHSALVREAALYWANGRPIDFSQLDAANGGKVPNPAGVRGSSLAGAPSLRGHLGARYEFDFAGYAAFAQIGAMHQSGSLASTGRLAPNPQGDAIDIMLPAFTSVDAALGLGRDAWGLQVNGENLSDARAQLYSNGGNGYQAITIARPRTVNLRLSYSFGG